MMPNVKVSQRDGLPSQNNITHDDKLRVITESGWGEMRNESRMQEREDER